VKKIIAEGRLSKYVDFMERTIEDMNTSNDEGQIVSLIDFAAAMLKMVSDSGGSESEDDTLVSENNGLSVDDEDTGAEEGYVRLFINVGRKDKIQPGNIVQSIASTSGLPGKLIGAIDIYDNYTFVEVPKEHARKVLDSMKDFKLKGRKVNIERSNKRPVLKRRFSGRRR
jgi:ATP-dependent RNA helicase DeaD